jgi:hypothetical protein
MKMRCKHFGKQMAMAWKVFCIFFDSNSIMSPIFSWLLVELFGNIKIFLGMMIMFSEDNESVGSEWIEKRRTVILNLGMVIEVEMRAAYSIENAGSTSSAIHLAEKYYEYTTLVTLINAEDLENRDRILKYMDAYGKPFSLALFDWYLNQGKYVYRFSALEGIK